jgi:Ca2+-binding RTX toxin-like protein
VFRHPFGVVRRIIGSALVISAVVVPGVFPRPAAAVEALGSVTIVQATPANPSQAFAYSSNVPEMLTSFYLDQDPTTYPQPWETSLYVTPGQYLVEQDPQQGWRISDIQCTDPDGNSSGDVSSRSATIRMDAGEEIYCTFTNVPAVGDIVIHQTTIPQDPVLFEYSGDIGPFSLADDGDEQNDGTWRDAGSSGLIEGTYQLSQQAVAGWHLTDISCSDPDGGTTVDPASGTVTFDVDAEETIDCTFTNQKDGPPAPPPTGSVTLTLDAVPDSLVNVGFGGDLGSFVLDDDADPALENSVTAGNVAAGQKIETITLPAGWQLTSLVCADPDAGSFADIATATMTIDLDGGEAITCVATIAPALQHNQINVNLDTVPNDPVDVVFDFGSILHFTLDDDFDGTHLNGQEYNDMDLGPWPLFAHVPSGWQLKAFTCSDPDGGTTVSTATTSAEIDLDDGEVINCSVSIEPIPQSPPPAPAPTCNSKAATIVGRPGNTTIRGTAGDDVIVDLDGANRIDGRGGNDTICTGAGADVIGGSTGDDWIDAGAGNDRVDGGKGLDTYVPGPGTNTVRNCEA